MKDSACGVGAAKIPGKQRTTRQRRTGPFKDLGEGASSQARKQTAAILEVLAGVRTPTQAATHGTAEDGRERPGGIAPRVRAVAARLCPAAGVGAGGAADHRPDNAAAQQAREGQQEAASPANRACVARGGTAQRRATGRAAGCPGSQ
jgi:hypothetical protein